MRKKVKEEAQMETPAIFIWKISFIFHICRFEVVVWLEFRNG